MARRDRRCSVWIGVAAEHELAAFDDEQAPTGGASLTPQYARIDKARQPHRSSSGQRGPERQPFQLYLHELGRPDGDATIAVGRVFRIVQLAISTTFLPQACPHPKESGVWREVDARQLWMRGAQPVVTRQ